jgi:hypothetical protein
VTVWAEKEDRMKLIQRVYCPAFKTGREGNSSGEI